MTRTLTTLLCAALALGALAVPAQDSDTPAGPTNLAVVWTSGDPDVAHRMALMYTGYAARSGDWDEVVLVVWGPSQRLLVGDESLQTELAEMAESGVTLRACVVCANSYGVADDLEALGLEVLPMGGPLTGYLQDPAWSVMTY